MMTEREIIEYKDGNGTIAYIGLCYADTQLAGAIRQDDDYEKRSGYRWQIWTKYLSISFKARPLAARDEESVRAWLDFIGNVYEGKLGK